MAFDTIVILPSLANGQITTFAGTGTPGYSGDGGPASAAQLNYPMSVCADASGNVYIPDRFNHRIRKVDAVTGIISTIAGTGTPGYSGDGGPAGTAQLHYPAGISIDLAGNLYVADLSNYRIRKIDAVTGIITTIAGTGVATYSGDGGPATAAALRLPLDMHVDASGNVFIVDHLDHRIRKIDAATGTMSTLAGTGSPGYSGVMAVRPVPHS